MSRISTLKPETKAQLDHYAKCANLANKQPVRTLFPETDALLWTWELKDPNDDWRREVLTVEIDGVQHRTDANLFYCEDGIFDDWCASVEAEPMGQSLRFADAFGRTYTVALYRAKEKIHFVRRMG